MADHYLTRLSDFTKEAIVTQQEPELLSGFARRSVAAEMRLPLCGN
jgi:hypothetical protein